MLLTVFYLRVYILKLELHDVRCAVAGRFVFLMTLFIGDWVVRGVLEASSAYRGRKRVQEGQSVTSEILSPWLM